MSVRRLLSTTAAMAALAWALGMLTPSFADMTGDVLAPQRTADSAGAETLVLAVAGLAAWGVWAWGAVGLVLTAGSALPGVLGQGARALTGVVLPGAARRGAALALGIGLGVAGPLAGTTLMVVSAPPAAAGTTSTSVPDWPEVPGAAAASPPASDAGPSDVPRLPDWPAPRAVGDHVVVRGDCLWDIAAAHLSDQLGRSASAAETAGATSAWWAANAAVIGPDPDVLLPGQVLRPPPA
jgi:hypothetical protein